MTFAPGLLLHDRYDIVEQIGIGGMSEVWLAIDQVLDRPVAVKALTATLEDDPDLMAATWREARATAKLTHPHVTQVYDYGEETLRNGAIVPYLVMELLDGRNLADRLTDGPLPWPDAVRMASQVAAGLAAAHRMGVVHRDVKPGNVMLTDTGAKVLDFGIAAFSGTRPDVDGAWLVGTPAYAAPERLTASAPDPAADVYALGALLYESLTGEPPLPVVTWDEAEDAHRMAPTFAPPAVPDLPPAVAALCLACLSRDPGRRPRAQQVADALEAAATPAKERRPVDIRRPAGPTYQRGVARAAAAPDGPPSGDARFPSGRRMPSPGPRTAIARAVPPSAPPPRPGAPVAPRRRRLRPSLMLLTGLLLAGGLTAAAVASFVPSQQPGSAGPPRATGPARPTTAAPDPTPTSAAQVVALVDETLEAAIAAGRVDDNAADDLRDGIDDLRQTLNRDPDDLRREAAELLEQINEFNEDSLDQEARFELTLALNPLLTT
jgi:serine/threonine protein kinase